MKELTKHRIIITSGEPSGIGPDLMILLAQKKWPIEIVVCADPTILIERAKLLKLPINLYPYYSTSPSTLRECGELTILPIYTSKPVIAGILNVDNSYYVIKMLDIACDKCLSGEFAALITAPVHKGIINQSGIEFIGHTEYLAKRTKSHKSVMMLITSNLRVALVTTHLPLLSVSKSITAKTLNNTIIMVNDSLVRDFGIVHPKIYVCGLNPHAGENGYIGREEIDVIIPTLNKLRNDKGYDLVGPLSADTIFQEKYTNEADLILSMYHDQCFPILKYKNFNQLINITLGLPFIRTSVGHGTAIELAGSGKAITDNIITVLHFTIKMIINKFKNEQ